MERILLGKCEEILPYIIEQYKNRSIILVSDPPFNIGYKYDTYKDNMKENEYYNFLKQIFGELPSVIIHYPESLYKISQHIKKVPERVVSWVYNSNTARQHRDIAFFGVKPDFNKIKQPYKNLNDKRIMKRIADGKIGAKLYDWWNVNQVKNVNKDKTNHPCQMPLEVMKNIIGLLPDNTIIIDPFLGSGTTGLAVKKMNIEQNANRDFIGIEMDENYCKIAQERLNTSL